MRVLIVSTTMDCAGAETLIMNIYRNLDRKLVQFDFILHCDYKSDYEDEILYLGGKVFKFPPYRIYNELSYRKAFRLFFKNHPEYKVIHGHIYNSASIYLDEARKCGLRTIAHSHSTTNGKGPKAWIRDFLHRNLYRIAEYRFACSAQAGKWLYRNKADFTVIKNGIDTDKFRFDADKRISERKKLGVSPSSIVIGHVGRFEAVKNHDFLIDIFSLYHSKNKDSKLLLVGSGSLEEKLRKKVEELSLTDSVFFSGVRQDVDNLLSAMDVFVFPSFFEGFPVTLVEAQCSGLPCIISDVITDDVDITGNIVKLAITDNAECWSSAIERESVKKRTDKSAAVRESGYDIRDTAKQLQDFYLSLESQ